ncbi:sugar ABC transporter substrate-binding protein [Bifidobacterium imperatoris]|nr:sugar ABC transporter substrate-binding protein [Bifidobacterium imperatoris]
MSFNKVTRALAGIAAAAMLIPLAACGGSGNGGSATAEGIPAKGTDDGTEITLWTRSPLERQAKAAVEAYNKSHKNQVKLEIIPNDDMEGKVGGASQTDSLPDILAGDVVRIPYWASEGIFTEITDQINGLDNLKDIQQGHIKAGTVDGAEYTLPFITDVSVWVWNKDLYKEAGLDPEQGPTDIKTFTEQAKKVAALNKDGVAGSYLAGQSGGALVFDLFPSV